MLPFDALTLGDAVDLGRRVAARFEAPMFVVACRAQDEDRNRLGWWVLSLEELSPRGLRPDHAARIVFPDGTVQGDPTCPS